ncbi:hypothetical protein FRC00_000080, partial [Tulasnella sp. 408]
MLNEVEEGIAPITPAETVAPSASSQQDVDVPRTATEERDPYHVRLEGDEDPKSKAKFKKWMAVIIICSAATCVTCTSSV